MYEWIAQEGDGGVMHEFIVHDSFERLRLRWWGE